MSQFLKIGHTWVRPEEVVKIQRVATATPNADGQDYYFSLWLRCGTYWTTTDEAGVMQILEPELRGTRGSLGKEWVCGPEQHAEKGPGYIRRDDE